MEPALINDACAYIWVYEVKPAHRDAFVDAYGPDGVWKEFFSKSPDYIRTDLLTDAADPNRFVTVDYFTNANARPALVEAHAKEFSALDAQWEEVTLREEFVGAFSATSRA